MRHALTSGYWPDSFDHLRLLCQIYWAWAISNYGSTLSRLPYFVSQPVSLRTAILNCLTTHYAPLWAEVFTPDFTTQRWSQPDNPRLPQDLLRQADARMAAPLRPQNRLRPPHGAGRNRRTGRPGPRPHPRRTAADLPRPVPGHAGYERDTWYDLAGRIVFTNSKGLVGVGLPRKGSRSTADVTFTTPDGRSKTGKYGWDDIHAMQEAGTLPAGSTVTTTVIDDTQPGGPQTRTRPHLHRPLRPRQPRSRLPHCVGIFRADVRELERQIASALYERLALSRDRDAVRRLSAEGQVLKTPCDAVKDPYVLEFLGLEERPAYSESELEAAIIDKLEHFLLELGKGFLFEARQKRFSFEEDHFYVDLVFYNRLLRCYVLIDLKLDKLTHQDLGQMQMYVNFFDRYVKTESENPTIGIVLCKRKKDALIELTDYSEGMSMNGKAEFIEVDLHADEKEAHPGACRFLGDGMKRHRRISRTAGRNGSDSEGMWFPRSSVSCPITATAAGMPINQNGWMTLIGHLEITLSASRR
jgi:predicted nuclease of restriction endonuclease-like (RecB) superfamily